MARGAFAVSNSIVHGIVSWNLWATGGRGLGLLIRARLPSRLLAIEAGGNLDGGFGVDDLGPDDGRWGNGEFNVTPLIEAANDRARSAASPVHEPDTIPDVRHVPRPRGDGCIGFWSART